MREGIPPKYKTHFKKAVKSRKSAITAMCLECMGYVKSEIPECTDIACPLYSHRPYVSREVAKIKG